MNQSGKFLLFLALVVLLISSCKKDKTDPNAQGQAEFTVSLSQLKSTLTDTIASNLAFVVVSIEDEKGKVVKNSEKIELYNMQGNYISKPLGLLTGNYKLTRFLVLDRNNNIVYASPTAGSAKAYLVRTPLPISFTVSSNAVVKVTPEVLKTLDSKPEDFGYATFGFEIAQSFDFLLGVFVYDNTARNFGLTPAQLKITSNNTIVYEGALNAIYNGGSEHDTLSVTNKVTLPERYSTFIVQVSKTGYKTYSKTFSKEDLRKYFLSVDNGPLVVVLNEILHSEGLVAYYPFSENLRDYSGNNNNGTSHGAIFTKDRFNKDNSACYFDGNSWVQILNSSSLNLSNDKSVSVWIYLNSGQNFSMYPTIISKNDNSSYYPTYMLQLNEYSGYLEQQYRINFFFGKGIVNYQCTTSEQYNNYFNQWIHIAATYSKADGISKIYFNGVLSNTLKVDNISSNENTDDLYIGRSGNTEKTFFNGKIDDIRIYNRALSQEEILMLYNE